MRIISFPDMGFISFPDMGVAIPSHSVITSGVDIIDVTSDELHCRVTLTI